MNRDSAEKFAATTLVLHWVVGLSIIGLLAVGIYMEETKAYALYPLHKSFGVIIFFIAAARIVWRIQNGWPSPAGPHQRWEHLLARTIHWVLIDRRGAGNLPAGQYPGLVSAIGWHLYARMRPGGRGGVRTAMVAGTSGGLQQHQLTLSSLQAQTRQRRRSPALPRNPRS